MVCKYNTVTLRSIRRYIEIILWRYWIRLTSRKSHNCMVWVGVIFRNVNFSEMAEFLYTDLKAIGGRGSWSKIIDFLVSVSVYLFSTFILLSPPFYRIQKIFTIGPKLADMLGWGGTFFTLSNSQSWRKPRKWLILCNSEELQATSMYYK